MPTYATADDLRADPDVADDLDEAVANKRLEAAEDLVDRLVGPRLAGANGRKWNIAAGTGLSTEAVNALRDATVLLAVEEVKDPAAFTPPAGDSISGPDFTISKPNRVGPAGELAIRRAAAKLSAHGLRVTGARARP